MNKLIPLSSGQWHDYFIANNLDLIAIPWDLGVDLSPRQRHAIAASLAEFQLGESSEGRHLLSAAAEYSAQTGDEDYLPAMRRFIAEEQRHARDLGKVLDLAGMPRLAHTWRDSVFRRLRRGAGLELTLTILLAAELIALVYYAAIQDATQSRVLQTLCRQLLRDEVQHVRFHCERFAILRRYRSRIRQAISTLAFTFFFTAVTLVVWRKHRRALRCGNVGFIAYLGMTRRELHRALHWMNPRNYTFPATFADSPSLRALSEYRDLFEPL